MGKHLTLTTPENQRLKQLSNRKIISVRAHQQIQAILKLHNDGQVVEVAEEIGVSFQTLMKWRVSFKKDRLKSLLVFLEKGLDNGSEDKQDNSDEDNDDQSNEVDDSNDSTPEPPTD